MVPKTEIQRKVVALSAKLPGITKAQEARFNAQTGMYAVRSKLTVYCLECGHQWIDPFVMGTTLLGCTCPKCNTELEMDTAYEPHHKRYEYCALLTTCNNMQVIRMFFITKLYLKRSPAFYFTREVMQHWIEPSGRMTTMATKANSMSQYVDQWVCDSTLEVRTNTDRMQTSIAIGPHYIHPNPAILPVLRRNGFKGNFHKMSPQQLFPLILSNNYAETLLKTKQFALFKAILSSPETISKYWNSIRICIKHNYLVKDASMWLDNMTLLEYFQKDLYSPKYICPADLHHSHKLLINKKAKIDARIERSKLLEKFKQQQVLYSKAKKKFFGLSFVKGDLEIKPLVNVTEFFDEGKLFSHCIYSNGYFQKKNSLVLSARLNSIPIETVEISLRPIEILQARGRFNKPTKHHDLIMNLVNENLPLIAKCI